MNYDAILTLWIRTNFTSTFSTAKTVQPTDHVQRWHYHFLSGKTEKLLLIQSVLKVYLTWETISSLFFGLLTRLLSESLQLEQQVHSYTKKSPQLSWNSVNIFALFASGEGHRKLTHDRVIVKFHSETVACFDYKCARLGVILNVVMDFFWHQAK